MSPAHTRSTHTKPTAAEDADATEKWLDSLDPTALHFRDATSVRSSPPLRP